jgi:hypothetical protein
MPPGKEKSIDNNDISFYRNLINANFFRTHNLVTLAEKFPDSDYTDDILRAVVVLTHAYLEDFVRTLASHLLPEAGETILKEIPLGGSSGRAEKFHLGHLVQHKGKLVDDVIRESILKHLQHSSFNNVDDVVHLLESVGFEVAPYSKHFPQIKELMQRRHLIVHQTDRIQFAGGYTLQAIHATQVKKWIFATSEFLISLSEPLGEKIAAKSSGERGGPK